jgi:hypothetical protein
MANTPLGANGGPRKRAHPALLWVLFFLICLGLGYPILNRYDPGKLAGTSDVNQYRNIVVGQKSKRAAEGVGVLARIGQQENYYRVLVPYVAKPFYWLARGRVDSWDPALVGLLVASSIFTATTAFVLVAIGCSLGFEFSTSLVGAFIFLLNFCVSNMYLVGLVDSAEACFLILIVWSLLKGRWFLLPLWGVFGALGKETFAPLSVMLVFGWWLAGTGHGRLRIIRLGWIAALGIAGIATVTVMMSSLAGGLVLPWQFAATMRSSTGFFTGLRGCLTEHTFLYVFVWLLPLGLLRIRQFPRTWSLAVAVAFSGALLLGAYNNAEGNTTRALFNIAGPLLSLSVAMLLTGSQPAGFLSSTE